QSGRLRFLAVSSEARFAGDPTPTIREAGLNVVLANWRSVAAPPGTSDVDRKWWVDALRKMRNSAAWQQILQQNDWEDSFLTGVELEQFIADETKSNANTLNAMGLGPSASRYPYVVAFGLSISLIWLWMSRRGKATTVVP